MSMGVVISRSVVRTFVSRRVTFACEVCTGPRFRANVVTRSSGIRFCGLDVSKGWLQVKRA